MSATREEVLGRMATIRLECLRLAGSDIQHARDLYEFVTGLSDAPAKERLQALLKELGVA